MLFVIRKYMYGKFYLILIIGLWANLPLIGQYCSSNSTNSNASKIDNIRLVGETVTINQNSVGPCETYTDYTALPAADLMLGNSYTVEVTLGTCNNNRDKSANVYIDFNQDNDFNDPGEDLGNTGLTNGTATLSINFTIGMCPQPSLGLTRMRIVAVQGTGAISPCGTYTRGETEDYSVRIITPAASGAFYLVGNAVSTGASCVQLTSAVNSQLGMAWDIGAPLNFTLPFSYDFTVNLGSDNGGADGIMFIVQNDPNLQCVTPAGGWGAGNISNSLCIEIDTYLNFEDRDDGLPGVVCTGSGTEPDHLDIWLNGNINPTTGTCGTGARIIPAAIPLLDGGVDYNIENGLNHIFRITWIPGLPGTLTATILNAAGTTSYGTVSYSFDPMTVFGTNTPMYGFSASTGGLNNQQSFCSPTILLNNDLMAFDAQMNTENTVYLEWLAMTPNNGGYFEVEKSRDGQNFEMLTTVLAQGNAQQPYKYNSTDPYPFIGDNYYRLRQVDAQGTSIYSPIKVIHRKEGTAMINVYPNPVQNQVTIEFLDIEKKEGTVVLYNHLGQTIQELSLSPTSKMTVDVSTLVAGVYFLQIKNVHYTSKLFKLIKQ